MPPATDHDGRLGLQRRLPRRLAAAHRRAARHDRRASSRPGPGDNPGMEGPKASTMYDPTTGATIPFTGLTGTHAMMPSFSPDGTKIVFNDTDNGGGHTLVVMDFDASTNTFSNAKHDLQGHRRLPGLALLHARLGKSVVFADGDSSNFASSHRPARQRRRARRTSTSSTWRAASPTRSTRPTAFTRTARRTCRTRHARRAPELLPDGQPRRRGRLLLGLLHEPPQLRQPLVDPDDNPPSKKLWVSAITIGAHAGAPTRATRPSTCPARSSRAATSARSRRSRPCKANGQSCTSGVDCCGGALQRRQRAARRWVARTTDEKCTTAADCCGPGLQCINGFCESVVQ